MEEVCILNPTKHIPVFYLSPLYYCLTSNIFTFTTYHICVVLEGEQARRFSHLHYKSQLYEGALQSWIIILKSVHLLYCQSYCFTLHSSFILSDRSQCQGSA